MEAQHGKAFEGRPSSQAKRKGEGEVKALVGEVQRLRSEHDKLMKKLHAKEVGMSLACFVWDRFVFSIFHIVVLESS